MASLQSDLEFEHCRENLSNYRVKIRSNNLSRLFVLRYVDFPGKEEKY